jgi:hypothetical protein
MSYVKPSMAEALKDHVLEEVLQETAGFRAFYLKMPGKTRMMSTLFVFTPEGIVIMGDLCPGGPRNQGCISTFNYGLGWFATELSEHYMCSKFLGEVWQPEVALEWLRANEKDLLSEGFKAEDLIQLDSSLAGGEMDEASFRHDLEDAGYEMDDELPGYDYDLDTAGWLCALQQRFSELYIKSQKVEVKA